MVPMGFAARSKIRATRCALSYKRPPEDKAGACRTLCSANYRSPALRQLWFTVGSAEKM